MDARKTPIRLGSLFLYLQTATHPISANTFCILLGKRSGGTGTCLREMVWDRHTRSIGLNEFYVQWTMDEPLVLDHPDYKQHIIDNLRLLLCIKAPAFEI